MDHHRKLSGSSDDSDASDNSIDHPPSFNGAGKKPEEILLWKRKTFDTFKSTIEELKSEYDRNHPTLIGQIKKLKDITDEIESVLKSAAVGSLVGATVGAVGGIAALVGLALAPFTLGASLSLITVGAVAGVTGGVTASNIINMFKQKKLRPTLEKIISDFLKTIKPMNEHLSIISDITADIQQKKEILSKLQIQTPVRGFDDLFKTAKVADMALVGKNCAEASKEIRVYVKDFSAIRGSALAASAMCAAAAAAAGTFSFLFLALKSASIVQDLIKSHEMNQPTNARKPEEIKSETLKFIHYMRETASQFQETLDKIKYVISTFNQMLQNSTSLRPRPRGQ